MKLLHVLLLLGVLLAILLALLLGSGPDGAGASHVSLETGSLSPQDESLGTDADADSNRPESVRQGVDFSSSAKSTLASLSTASVVVRILDGLGNPILNTTALARLGMAPKFPSLVGLGYLDFFHEEPDWIGAQEAAANMEVIGILAADGLFSFSNLPPGDWWIDLGSTPWLTRALKVKSLRPQEKRDLGTVYLTPAASLRGRVVNAAGQGIAKVRVSALPHDPSPMRDMGWPGNSAAVDSDATGSFVIPNLESGPYQLTADFPAHLQGKAFAMATPVPEHSLIQLESGARVRGQVLDLEGRPVADALVLPVRSSDQAFFRDGAESEWQGWQKLDEAGIPTDEQGIFVVQGLVGDGKDGLVAQLPDSTTRTWLPNVLPGDTVELRFLPQTVLVVKLLDQNEQPVPNQSISVFSNSNPYPNTQFNTDEQGLHRWVEAEPGTVRLTAITPQGVAETELEVKEGTETQAVMKLEGQAKLRVLVTAPDGLPIANSKVRVSFHHATFEVRQSPMQDFGKRNVTTRTDAEGIALLQGLTGELKLQVSAEGFGTTNRVVQLAEGETQDFPVALESAGSLQVLVLDASGAPQPRVALRLLAQDSDPTDQPGQSLRGNTDSSGVASWKNLQAGPWNLSLSSSSSGPQTMVFEGHGDFSLSSFSPPAEAAPTDGKIIQILSGETLEEILVVEKMALLTVQVMRHGNPVPGATVQWANSGFSFGMRGRDSLLKTDGGGYFALPPRQPGSHELEATATPWAPPSLHKVELQSGSQTKILELPDGRVRGSASGIASPVRDAMVSLVPHQEASPNSSIRSSIVMISSSLGGETTQMSWQPGQGSTRTDAQGKWEFEDVPAGTWKVQIQAKGYVRWESDPFGHNGRETRDLGLAQLQEGGSLSGQIYGLPVAKTNLWNAGQWIYLRHIAEKGETNRESRYGQIQPNGTYFFRDLPPGRYKVTVNGPDITSFSSKVVTVGEGPKVLDISMPQ